MSKFPKSQGFFGCFEGTNFEKTAKSQSFIFLTFIEVTLHHITIHHVTTHHITHPCTISPGQVGAYDFLVENECCINLLGTQENLATDIKPI